MDIQYGHTFWNNLEGKGCILDHYSILYYGYAEKVTDYTNDKNNITTYILNSQHTTFAFKITEQTSICQIIALRTLHPRILILDNKNTALNQILQNIPIGNTGVQDLDTFTYVNQKFVFTEHHINLQADKLYIYTSPTINHTTNKDEVKVNMGQNEHTNPVTPSNTNHNSLHRTYIIPLLR